MRLKRRGILVVALLAFLAYVVYRSTNRKSDLKYAYGPARALRPPALSMLVTTPGIRSRSMSFSHPWRSCRSVSRRPSGLGCR